MQRSVIDKLLDILAYYHPEPAIIFLALWYLSRLIPRGLVNYCDFHGEESTEVMARIFLLGLTLANKWFDDFVTKNKYWCAIFYKLHSAPDFLSGQNSVHFPSRQSTELK